MSGIAGICHANGQRVDRLRLERMIDSLGYRGPDERNVWCDGAVGLAQCLLHTVPDSASRAQPPASSDQSLRITADVRVDNRDELRETLEASGAAIEGDSDAELLLHCYRVWGERCTERIIGDFAFAIWDGTRRRLFCARDPIGIKSFYYHFDGTTFSFASSPRALCAGGVTPCVPNLRVICLSLLNRFDERNETHYQGIIRLPAAHNLVLDGGQVATTRYWEIDPGRTVTHATDQEYDEHFLELWRHAVSSRLRSRNGVGVLLSGGLDSSAVACTAAEIDRAQNRDRLEAYSVVFGAMPCDERPHINAVLQKSNIRNFEFPLDQHASWLDFDQVARFPECFYTPTLLFLGPAFAEAQGRRVRVMLTGIGGDDLVASSVVHLTDMLRERRFGELIRQLRCDAELLSCSRWSLIREYCAKPLIPAPLRSLVRRIRSKRRVPAASPWIRRDCLDRFGLAEPPPAPVDRPNFPTLAQQRIWHGIVRGWNTNVALSRLDSFAAHFAIECRHPFLDRRLVEFLCAIPESHRWSGRWRKTILRRAMAGILPESVRWRRSKADFSPVVDREFCERQRDRVDRLLRNSALETLGIIAVSETQRLFDRYWKNAVSGRERLACHALIGLELWCRSNWELKGGGQADSKLSPR